MKANEAPEELYLHPTAKGNVGASWLPFPLTDNDIEYTRTDAFIEKAEEFAIKKYPVSIEDIYGHKVDVNLWQRKACVDGYHQAEKDLELGWEDMRELYIIFAEVDTEIELCKTDIKAETIGYYEEVLKRFKNFKERKEK